MKTKIIGILVCMLLIATMAIPISALNKIYEIEPEPISNEADVPTWEVGDTWTYDTHNYIAASPNVTDAMVVNVNGELILEVVDDTGDTYKLTGTMTPMNGIVDLPGNLDLRITRISSYNSNLEIQKTDLSLINHEFTMKGICLFTLGPIPLPIPIQMQYYRSTEFDPIWEILPFPLYDGKTGEYENCTMTIEWDVSMFWGLIPIDSGIDYDGWVGDGPYTCEEDTITVEAGTFDVFNVSGYVDFGEAGHDYYYTNYAEDVGNIAKGIYNIDADNGNTMFLIELELIETTYTP